MRRMLIAVLGALALVLTACAGLPTTGTVQPGPQLGSDSTAPDVIYRPDGPQPGATARQIVDGFVRAASGPQDNWQVARQFLAEDYRDQWKPEAGVIVDVLADRSYAEIDDEIVLDVTPQATIDEAGTYTLSDEGASVPLPFSLAQDADGEWRITHAPDGIVLDEDLFRNVFRSYDVMYFDPTWRYLVPDVRWFPTTNALTRIAAAVVNGEPSPWLAASVVSAFPDNVTLVPSVPLTNGVAQAQLSEQALGLDQVTLDRMQTQLSASLVTAQVTAVEMQVDGARVNASRIPTRSTLVDSRALVRDADGFGYLLSGELTPLPGLSSALIEAEPTAVQLGVGRTVAAVLLPDGSAAEVTDDGVSRVVDERAGVLAPTIDPFGMIWTVPAADPSRVRATGTDGTVLEVPSAWGASRIDAMQISRDGSRMAAVLTAGGRSLLVVAGVERDSAGVPSALGPAVSLATLDAPTRGLAWLDTTTIGVVSGDAAAPVFVQQVVGGAATVVDAPVDAVALSGANSPAAVRILAADGTLFVRRQSNWVQTATGVQVLATQQGDAD
ncbi:LpqB family beta-propeller domain-containing protein [Microbacterium sp. Clip185]|uniref:LpqB family beta-propeller domain-containing protein n=1 Tax=Microbacterium sp. Clip185 TaxID=3025663 RepID=UPI0023655271|nr:LpqB family beta-propeller domain-containing protein [Microbacterium sp. Clip185]WDG18991.1 LpqB family beta-propeller domain-containing protein [Microbacterium sp. Clip185]